MFLLADSDTDALLRHRRTLYLNDIYTIGMDYRDALDFTKGPEIIALILTNPYDTNIPQYFTHVYRRRHPGIPIVAIEQPLRTRSMIIKEADIVLDADVFRFSRIPDLLTALTEFHHRDIADYMLYEFRDHLLMPAPVYDMEPFYLTHIERAILRYLMNAYPRQVTARELLRYCAKPGTSPTGCNIPTHIYHINQKTLKKFKRHIINCPDNLGYRLILSD